MSRSVKGTYVVMGGMEFRLKLSRKAYDEVLSDSEEYLQNLSFMLETMQDTILDEIHPHQTFTVKNKGFNYSANFFFGDDNVIIVDQITFNTKKQSKYVSFDFSLSEAK